MDYSPSWRSLGAARLPFATLPHAVLSSGFRCCRHYWLMHFCIASVQSRLCPSSSWFMTSPFWSTVTVALLCFAPVLLHHCPGEWSVFFIFIFFLLLLFPTAGVFLPGMTKIYLRLYLALTSVTAETESFSFLLFSAFLLAQLLRFLVKAHLC